MLQKLTLCAVALTSLGLFSPASLAADFDVSAAQPGAATPASQPTLFNQLTLGLQGVGGTNTGQYGRYNGFTIKASMSSLASRSKNARLGIPETPGTSISRGSISISKPETN